MSSALSKKFAKFSNTGRFDFYIANLPFFDADVTHATSNDVYIRVYTSVYVNLFGLLEHPMN